MAKRKKTKTSETLPAAVQRLAAELGVPLKFEADADLATKKRGKLLNVGQLRAIAQTGGVVWARYKEDGESGFRVNGPYRASLEGTEVSFRDGSSFDAGEFDLAGRADSDEAVEEGQGLFEVFEAR